MSALAEALLAAQRGTLAAIQRAYLAGALDEEDVPTLMDAIGCTDKIEQGQFLAALEALRGFGVQAPATTNGTTTTPETELASDAQWTLLRKLADEKGKVAPNGILTKTQASAAINQLKAGTYNSDAYATAF